MSDMAEIQEGSPRAGRRKLGFGEGPQPGYEFDHGVT